MNRPNHAPPRAASPTAPAPDRAALVGRLVGAHRAELLAFARGRVGDRTAAEDVVQQAAARAVAKAHQLRDEASGRAWLFRITRHVLAERPRRVQAAEVELDDDGPAADDDGGDGCACVLAQVGALKPEYAALLSRVVIEGQPVKAAAAELGITTNNAMVRLHRARAALRDQLRSHCGVESARGCLDCDCVERGCCAEA